jgi:hypothetical protein
MQFAFGGFRLTVPESEAMAAAVLLQSSALADPEPEDSAPQPRAAGGWLRVAAGILLVFGGSPEFGWLAARRRPLRTDMWLGVLLATAAVIAFVIALSLVGWVLHPPRF